MNLEEYKVFALENAARPYVSILKGSDDGEGEEVIRCYVSTDIKQTYSLANEFLQVMREKGECLTAVDRWKISEKDLKNLILSVRDGDPPLVLDLRMYEFVVNKSSPEPYISVEWGDDGIEPGSEIFRLSLGGDETFLRNLVNTFIKSANEIGVFAPAGPIDHLKGCEVTPDDLLRFIDMLRRGVRPYPRPGRFDAGAMGDAVSIVEGWSHDTPAERAAIALLKSLGPKWERDLEEPSGVLLVRSDIDVIHSLLTQLKELCRDSSLPKRLSLSPDGSGATGSRSHNDIEGILRVLSHDDGAGLRRLLRPSF
ncbi:MULTISPECIES: hypothetical protein [Pseudomonas syringae group]|uniref:hypothetical protein n=1 Tax=Pseudomonas syringae group TaxID=136849 RepID=UPI000E3206DD|nr:MULTISPECIES: hypothetical protein [Pseudomonas syringae group]